MGAFPWERGELMPREPTLNDDDGMFRGAVHEQEEDISGKLTEERARYLDDQNQRHMERFIQSIETLPLHHSRR